MQFFLLVHSLSTAIFQATKHRFIYFNSLRIWFVDETVQVIQKPFSSYNKVLKVSVNAYFLTH